MNRLDHSQRQAIEFYGGPVDGHVERFGVAIKAFVVIQTAPPVESISFLKRLLQLSVFHRKRQRQRIVLAVYELKTHAGQRGYHCLPCRIIHEARLDSHHVRAISQDADRTLRPLASIN